MKRYLIAALALLLATPTLANLDKAAKARAAFEMMDREDFLDGIEAASRCTANEEFDCANRHLARIKELINDDGQRQLWQQTEKDMKDARSQLAALKRAEEQERRAERAAQRRAEEEAHQKMIMGLVGSAAIVANSRNMSAQDSSRMLEAWNQDVQRGDGNFSSSRNLQANMQQDNQRRHAETLRRLEAQREAEQQRATSRQTQTRASVAVPVTASVSAPAPTSTAAAQAENSRRQAEERRLAAEQEAAARQQKELERQQQLAREKAEREARLAQEKAAKEAQRAKEAAEKEQAKKNYLTLTAQGIRLGALQCFGETHLRGSRPRIKPEEVACINVHYALRCPSSSAPYERGVAKNFTGFDTGCFGETYRIGKPACPTEKVIAEVEKVESCF